MSEVPFPENNEIRTRVLDALVLIHHADRLTSLVPALPAERIAFELCRMWFDTIYIPGKRYMDGLKGDFDPAAEANFIDAFSEEEYGWLERFHRFLELRIDRLSRQQRSECIFPMNDTWRGIMRDAGNLLDLMEGEPSRQTRRIETLFRELPPVFSSGSD